VKQSECLAIDNIHKRMGAVQALDGVSLDIRAGTVHGIIGHNGSGKSTLVKILSGVLRADRGTFGVLDSRDEERTVHRAPRVATVFQDLGLADTMSVFDNLLVNSFRKHAAGYVRISRERIRARDALATLGLDLPLDLEVRQLPEPERVMLCVARALLHAGVSLEGPGASADIDADGADVLLLDEPTSSLPRDELDRFRLLIKDLRHNTGVTVLVVTHNPNDIGVLCDEFTALRNGSVLCTRSAEGVTTPMLAELMAGKALLTREPPSSTGRSGPAAAAGLRKTAAPVFDARAIEAEGLSEPVSMSVDEGEFVGITGLEGSGFREFVEAAMGIKKVSSGTVHIDGQQVSGDVEALVAANAVYIPSDRARTSGVPVATVSENMTLGRVEAFCRRGVLNVKRERLAVGAMLAKLRVDPPDPRRVLTEMSGGQQQKVVVGRALLSGAKLLVLEEPTAAVDVGAREEILGYLKDVCATGNAVLVASADFEWMPTVCDRILVFRSGAVVGELLPGQMDEETMLRLAYGD
jgi:ribose transport system ATP-binding protein